MVRATAFGILPTRVLAAMLALVLGQAQAQDRAAEILFMSPHLSSLPAGAELTYRLERSPSDTQRLGQPFSDEIRLLVTSVDGAGGRDLELRIFTGDRARQVDGLAGLTGNPVLLVFLDRAVADMARLTGLAQPVLKNAIRAGLRDKATSEGVEAQFEGRAVKATRIVVAPFAGEAEPVRMLGYGGSRFEFLISEAAPGMLLELKAMAASTLPDAPRLEERIVLTAARVQR